MPVYVSPQLERAWGIGYSYLSDLTFESAAYVARYSMKKIAGDRDGSDRLIMKDTGEILRPEFIAMSRRPGIGTSWFKKFKSDVYPLGNRVVRGRDMRPPQFYDKLYQVDDPMGFEDLCFKRQEKLDRFDNSVVRLGVREEVTLARLKMFPRD